MSELRKMAAEAAEQVETIVVDMLEGSYPDNEILLGEGLCGDKVLQVQLYVTQDNNRFMDESGCRPYGRERFLDWSKEFPASHGTYLWREIGSISPNENMAYVRKDIDGRISISFELLGDYSDIQELKEREWFKIPQ